MPQTKLKTKLYGRNHVYEDCVLELYEAVSLQNKLYNFDDSRNGYNSIRWI